MYWECQIEIYFDPSSSLSPFLFTFFHNIVPVSLPHSEFAATDNKRREQRGNRALLEKRVGDALGTARSLLSAAGGRAGGEV